MLEAGATRLGVARVAEALHLSRSGHHRPIHVFSEPPPEAAPTLVEHDLTAAVYTEAVRRALSDAAVAAGKTVPVHVKLDTGMHRVGLRTDDRARRGCARLGRLPGLDDRRGMEPPRGGRRPDHPFTRKQLDLLRRSSSNGSSAGIDRLRYRHIANSAATLAFPRATRPRAMSALRRTACGRARLSPEPPISDRLWP